MIPHLKARDVTLIAVSGAPIEKLQAYRERMGWSFNWASSYESDFNMDVGFSSRLEQTREAIEPILDQLPRSRSATPRCRHGHLRLPDRAVRLHRLHASPTGSVFHTYSTIGRGVEFLMPYYGFLDRAPKGRDEDDGWQLWIRRHDEYDPQSRGVPAAGGVSLVRFASRVRPGERTMGDRDHDMDHASADGGSGRR